ncbi:restriction endonuclease subunit S [Nonlabens mediterrranea]|uniref:Restriction endonuclease subunit S n=1 Tax=Nonlabens mediterrranea TaxID=1419947 RepID=A0ABS0A2P3_9FLAO|nr:restriction endonuclease subunit S [Nonlabens mediterrranea]
MPNNWKTYKLEELLTVLTDYHANGAYKKLKANVTLLDKEDYAVMIRTTNLERNNFDDLIYVDKHAYNFLSKSKVNPGDILMNKIANAGSIYQMPNLNRPVTLAMNLFLLRFNEKVNQYYLFYHLKAKEQYIKSFSAGSVTKTITKDAVRNLEFKIPPLPEQKAIASILSTIDDKIENNLAINKTLEEMAMALYKHWFVDFGPFQDGKFVDSELGLIPEGWKVKRLDEVAFKNSKTFDFKGKEKVVFVNTGDVQHGSFLHNNYSEIKGLPGQAKKVIEPNDILYSEIRPKNKRYAYVDFDSSDYVVSTKFMIIRNNEKINNRLLYRILTRQETIDEFQMIAESRSGTFPQITFDVIGHFPIVLPDIRIQNRFQSIVDPLELKQTNNLNEIKSLTKQRDTLLPKLISGEVRLKEFQEQLESISY